MVFLEFIGAILLLAVIIAFSVFMGVSNQRIFGRMARRSRANADAARQRAEYYRSVQDPAVPWGSGGPYEAPAPPPGAGPPGYGPNFYPPNPPYPPPQGGQPGYGTPPAGYQEPPWGPQGRP